MGDDDKRRRAVAQGRDGGRLAGVGLDRAGVLIWVCGFHQDVARGATKLAKAQKATHR
jgi:hypothetical protein